ncbi:hypothetical protein MMC18_009650 [Xylographa bjoerkii]|nr:hypothetical protein [Xylographa bjoerkii]
MQDHSKDTSVSRGSSVNSTRVITKPSPSEKQIQKIFQQLDDSTKRRDELSKAFLCKQDVQQIWSNIQDIREVFWPEIWAKYELEIVQLKFIKILSVLVLISAHTCIKNFRNTFFQTIQQATSCTDDDLPLAKEDLDQILQPSLARLFLEKQYVLIPFLIEDSEEQQIHRISEAYRLPFTKEKVGIGWGGYGTVDEVEIASGYLKQGDGAIFPYNKAIARKRIETDKNEEDFEKEVKNLQILKESLTSHSRIMRHLATIIHGSSFNILLPLAFFGDLELLLNDGISYNNPRKPQILYNFDSRFPGLTQQNLPEAILSEFSHLADGLRWLHDELCIVDGPELYCAHMDLKPSNILVDRDRHSLVGRWMLSDFGISVFRASTGRQDSQFASIGDVHAELTLQTRAKRGHGPYQAPEVQMLGPNTVGRRSDIWSLGCIFSEVLVFAIGRAPLLHKFRQARRNTYDDYFYSPRRESLSVVPGNGAYELRPSVKKWLEKLPNELVPPQQWVKCCVGTFLSILVVNDNLRPSAEDTGNLLKHAKEHLRTSMYGLPLQCRNLDHELPVQSSTNIPRGGMPLPALSIRTSLDLSPQAETSSALEDVQEQNESEVEARKVVTNVARQPEHISLENELSNINNSETYQGSLDTQSPTGLGLSGSSRTDSEPSLASAQRGHSIFSDNRVESGGIQIGPDVSRKSLGSHGRKLPPYVSYFKLTKSEARNTIALAISPHGNRVAYLCPDRLWIYSIKLYERPSVLENMEYLDLSSDKGWEMLTIAGMYIAAWGYSKVNAKRLVS